MSNVPALTLTEKRKEWLEVLRGKDRNSITNQLTQVTWDSASFRVVNEARRLAQPAPEGGVQLNGMVHSLINNGFFTLHMVAVRRLMDTYSLRGERGVYSLAGLLKDMEKHGGLLTRQAIFEAEGLAYDYEPIRQESLQYESEKAAAMERAYFVPPELDWFRHENRHQAIDVLSGTTCANRRPSDTIRVTVFANLSGRAKKVSTEIINHASKFIAHAATPGSRALVKADEARLTLSHLWTAHEQLCQIVAFVLVYILGDSCPGFLAVPQFDQFQYIDEPLIGSAQVDQLRELWNDFWNGCHNWSQWGLDEYAKEFP